MVHHSTADFHNPAGHGAHDHADHHAGAPAGPSFFGLGDPHKVMYYVSAVIGLIGIGVAYLLHFRGRTSAAHAARAEALKARMGPVARWAERKWYFDELYDYLFRIPLWVLANVFYLIDSLVIDGIVNLLGWAPRGVGAGIRPSQNGVLQSYAVGMAGGLALILLIVWVAL